MTKALIAGAAALALAAAFFFFYNSADRKYQHDFERMAKERARIEKECEEARNNYHSVNMELASFNNQNIVHEKGMSWKEYREKNKAYFSDPVLSQKRDSLGTLRKSLSSRRDSICNLLRSYPPPEASR